MTMDNHTVGEGRGRHELEAEAEESALAETFLLADGQLRVFAADDGDRGPMYVLDVLGVSALIRERDGDVYVHIETQDTTSEPPDRAIGVTYEVNNGGGHSIGL